MTDLYTPAYAALQSQFHNERPDYGVSGQRYADQIQQLAKRLSTRDILDYGCGKCTLQKALPFPIQNYDPFISSLSQLPREADIVVCTDVMEHVEFECVESVLRHIHSLTLKAAFFQIATGPASKTLPDGRNAHITQFHSNWWLGQLINAEFDIKSLMCHENGFLVVASPLFVPAPPQPE